MKVEIKLIPEYVFTDGNFSCKYKTLLSSVKTLVDAKIIDFYKIPTHISEYLISKGYAVLGLMCICSTNKTKEFLDILYALKVA